MPHAAKQQEAVDVAVVGYGPVGMALTALLARRGHRVVVVERYPGLYNLPRAGVFDGETMRTWDAVGIADELLPTLGTTPRYDFRNGTGQVLAEFHRASVGDSGWADWYGMYQPYLEEALDQACRAFPQVEVRQSAPVTGLAQSAAGVALTVDGAAGPSTVEARYAVACDGGNSFVRRHLDIEQDDYGFGEAWLVCDFRLRRQVDLPATRQVCDPRQPIAIISLGPEHHRFSFMLDSEQDFERERRPERVWQKVARYLGPDDADLIRVGTYTFRSLVARSWRVGRVLLAGDAAHQMPPFLGQGMCSGIRDAQNLAFKLDLVLRGRAGTELLDTYQVEREPHVRVVTERGIELGRVQTMRDPVAAAERDRQMIAARAQEQSRPQIRLPGLTGGFLAHAGCPGRGELSIQGFVDAATGRTRLDAIVGHGFHLLVDAQLLPELARSEVGAALRTAGVVVVGIAGSPGDGGNGLADVVVDADGTYRDWFAERGWKAVAVRPDFYLYGAATDARSARVLAEELLAALGAETSMPKQPVRMG